MFDTDDYIQATKKFEQLRQEYLEWEAQAYHILNLLRQVDDADIPDRHTVRGDQLRLIHQCSQMGQLSGVVDVHFLQDFGPVIVDGLGANR